MVAEVAEAEVTRSEVEVALVAVVLDAVVLVMIMEVEQEELALVVVTQVEVAEALDAHVGAPLILVQAVETEVTVTFDAVHLYVVHGVALVFRPKMLPVEERYLL